MSDTLTPEAHDFVTHALADYYSGRRDQFRKETENIDWFAKDMKALEAAKVKHQSAERVAKIRKSMSHGAFGEGAWA